MGERITVTLEAAREGWLEDCVLRGFTWQTLRTYRRHSLMLVERQSGTDNIGELKVSDFTATLAREILGSRIRRGVALSTVATIHSTLSSFGRYCVAQHYLAENPMESVPRPRPRDRPHRYLTPDELRRLWVVASESRRRPEENQLCLLLLMEGLRAGEMCGLRWADVRADRIVVRGKGGKVRAIPLSARVRALLEERGRDQRDVARRSDNTGPFPTIRSVLPTGQMPRSPSDRSGALNLAPKTNSTMIFAFGVPALEARLRRWGREARIAGLHPHLLRHTFASLSLLAGVDEGTLRTLGGWSAESRVMERYLRSAREDAAIARAAEFSLTDRLLSEPNPGPIAGQTP
jgi:integrase